MSIKEKMNEARNKSVIDTYELLKNTDEWQGRSKTQRLYMMCIACDVTAPVMQSILKEVEIDLGDGDK